jgi:hypothetical protein
LWHDYKPKNGKRKDIVYVAQAKSGDFVKNDEFLTKVPAAASGI